MLNNNKANTGSNNSLFKDAIKRAYELKVECELGKIKSLLPLREMAISFGLVEEKPKSLRTPRGRKPFFSPEGKVALAFLKMYTGESAD